VAVANEGGKAVCRENEPLDLKGAASIHSSPDTEFAASKHAASWLAILPSMLPWIFLFLATPTVIFLSVCTPPFQSADEINHFLRSYQVSVGEFYGRSGGYVDQGILEVYSHYSGLPFKPNARVTAADEFAAASVKWTGKKVSSYFQNTSTSPPIGYLVQAVAIVLGKMAGLSVLHTAMLARLLNGALAIFISFLALDWCRRGKLFMFAVLLLPMTLSLFASCSQDALLISMCCLAFSLLSRQISEDLPLSWPMTILLASALLIVTIERPPYVPLLLVLLIPGLVPRWGGKPAWLTGLTLAGLSLCLTVIWWLAAFSSATTVVNVNTQSPVGARMQILALAHHPWILLPVMGNTCQYIGDYARSFIGVLGWLDTYMPGPYYAIMILMLLVALAGETLYTGRFGNRAARIVFLATLFTVASVFFIEYLVWTPVGALVVEGVQGRYLIPLAIAAGIALPCVAKWDWGYRWATALVVLCQPLTFLYLPKVIIERYYLR
jgi:hypothetical protein